MRSRRRPGASPSPALRRAAREKFDKYRQRHQNDQRRQQHAGDHHHRQGLLHLRSDPGRHRRRQQADARDSASHEHRAQLQLAGADHGPHPVEAFIDQLIVLRQDDDAVHHRDAEQRDKPDRSRYAEWNPGYQKPEHATEDRHRDHAHGEQRVDHRTEIEPQQHRDQREADRYYDRQPLDGVLQIAELADPLESRSWRKRDLGCDLFLGFPDRAAEITFADRKLDRQIALLLLPIDVGGTGDQVDRSNFAQGYLRDRAVRTRGADPQVLDRLGALAIFGRETDDNRKMPVATGFIEVTGAVATDRYLDGGVDISGR